MERTVTFRDRQELQAADLNNVEGFVRESLDDLVKDAVTSGKAYAGMQVTEATATSVAVAPGRLFNSGMRYVLENVASVDLFGQLPLVHNKIVAIVAWGLATDLDVQPRDFLINADTRQTQPQAVAMENQRAVQLQAVGGIESPGPQNPTLDISVVPIAWVLMTPTGISTITMADYQVPNLADHETRVRAIEGFDDVIGPRVTTLASDLSKLAASLAGAASNTDLTRAFADLARLKQIAKLPDTYADYGADEFIDYTDSDLTDLTFLALVDEGVRFSFDAQNYGEMAIFSALDANASLANGFLLPRYTSIKRLASLAYSGGVSISQYGYQTVAMVQKPMSRRRCRYGKELRPCTSRNFWQSEDHDPNPFIFGKHGEDLGDCRDDFPHRQSKHHSDRHEEYWEDDHDDTYWTYQVTNRTITGAMIAQTFLNVNDGWLTQIGLYFTALAGSGDINLDLVEVTANGEPDPSSSIVHILVPWASLKLQPTVTMVQIPPTFLTAGKRYAIILLSNAAHSAALAGSGAYTQGTLFYSTDGQFYMGDLTKDLMFELWFASFAATRVSIAMQPLTLSGGIAKVDIIAQSVVPSNCSLIYEAQVGGVWQPLTDLTPSALVGLPPLIPLRATFVGTTDIAPGIALTGSEVTVSRPRTTFKHISTPRLPAGPTSSIKVILRIEAWNAGHHTLTGSILPNGAGANNSPVVADQLLDATTLQRTLTFTMGAPTSNFRIELDGTTATALDVFQVAERVDIEF